MLTQDQRDNFRRALAVWNGGTSCDDDIDNMCDDSDIVVTAETINDFKAARGNPSQVEKIEIPVEDVKVSFGWLLIWKNVQSRKGARRGDFFLMDMGNARACLFTGE